MASNDEDQLHTDLKRMAAMRSELTDLGSSIRSVSQPEDESAYLGLRDALEDVLVGQGLLVGGLAVFDIAAWIIESIENESIAGFVKAHTVEEQT